MGVDLQKRLSLYTLAVACSLTDPSLMYIVMNPYTAERRDVLENTPPRIERFAEAGILHPEGNLEGRGVQNPC